MTNNNIDDAEDHVGKNFWEQLWQNNDTSWDIGQASPAITQYMS